MEGEKSSFDKYNLIYAALFVFTGAFVFCFSFLAGKSYEAILRNTIVSMLEAGIIFL